MPRMIALATDAWSELPLEDVAQKASEWGYQALEIACGGDHFAVQRAQAEPDYCRNVLDVLDRHELRLTALSNLPVGEVAANRVEPWHQSMLPDYVWGEGDPAEVATRAAQELIDTAKAAQQLGVSLVRTATGSPQASLLFVDAAKTGEWVKRAWERFAHSWKPILDAVHKCGVMLAVEVRPGQAAFDLYSAESALQALDGHPAFGFSCQPASLHWQGVDPVEFLRVHADHVWHILVQDVAIGLNGRGSLLGSLLPQGDYRRGWNFRLPGQGNLDWPGILRGLRHIAYDGPLTVAINDPDVDRDYAAAEAAQFIRRLDFEPARNDRGIFG